MTHAIEVEGVVRRYGDATALAGVDLIQRAGTVLGLLGPNGAGKTTMVRILATLLRPDEGVARVGGFDVTRSPHEVRRLIGLAGQYAAVDETLTGLENLVLLGRLLGLRKASARRRAEALLEMFALTDKAGETAGSYSGGTRRRLDLAASIVGRPQILFLDEPTTGLDPASRGDLWRLVHELVADGTTVLLTTQYLEEADRLADDIAVLDRGRVVATGTPDELKRRVGGEVLHVRPRDPADLERIRLLVEGVAGTAVVDEGAVSAPASPELLPAVVRAMDAAGVLAGELTMRRSTLDEVFLTLTGHSAATVATAGTPEGAR
jgi:oleandomycin transport system ATP-binding protein